MAYNLLSSMECCYCQIDNTKDNLLYIVYTVIIQILASSMYVNY
jgi:hypothetical protein